MIHGRVSSHRQPCHNFFGLEKNIPRHHDVGQLGVEGWVDVNGIRTCIVYSEVTSIEIPNMGSTGTAYIPLRSDGGWRQTQGLWLNRPPDLFYGCIWFVRSMESVSIIIDVCSVVHSCRSSLAGVDGASANRDLIAENQTP